MIAHSSHVCASLMTNPRQSFSKHPQIFLIVAAIFAGKPLTFSTEKWLLSLILIFPGSPLSPLTVVLFTSLLSIQISIHPLWRLFVGWHSAAYRWDTGNSKSQQYCSLPRSFCQSITLNTGVHKIPANLFFWHLYFEQMQLQLFVCNVPILHHRINWYCLSFLSF